MTWKQTAKKDLLSDSLFLLKSYSISLSHQFSYQSLQNKLWSSEHIGKNHSWRTILQSLFWMLPTRSPSFNLMETRTSFLSFLLHGYVLYINNSNTTSNPLGSWSWLKQPFYALSVNTCVHMWMFNIYDYCMTFHPFIKTLSKFPSMIHK